MSDHKPKRLTRKMRKQMHTQGLKDEKVLKELLNTAETHLNEKLASGMNSVHSDLTGKGKSYGIMNESLKNSKKIIILLRF